MSRPGSGALVGLAAVAALLALASARQGETRAPAPYYDRQIEAARLMHASLGAIRALRLSLVIPIDPALDPNATGIIGDEFTELTTSLGDLEAKRTSTNPAFAALLVKYFNQAGLRSRDVVAVGASGSFPALVVATLAAARALDLDPIVICSVGASMYGANLPHLTIVDMLQQLSAVGLIPYPLAAVSPGGDGDGGGGVLFDEDATTLVAAAERSGVPVIREGSVEASIRRRFQIFDECRHGRPIRSFVNIGGAAPNLGVTTASLQFPNGLVLRSPVRSTHPARGLVFEFLAQGIPVIHLLNIKGLALKNGLPVDPVPLPRIGEGAVYHVADRPRVTTWAALAASLMLLAAAGAFPAHSRNRHHIGKGGIL